MLSSLPWLLAAITQRDTWHVSLMAKRILSGALPFAYDDPSNDGLLKQLVINAFGGAGNGNWAYPVPCSMYLSDHSKWACHGAAVPCWSQVFHTLSIVTWEKILSISFNQHWVPCANSAIPFKFQLSQVELRVLARLRILQQHFLSSSWWESGWKGSKTAKFVPYMMTYMRALLNNLIRGWQHSMHWP